MSWKTFKFFEYAEVKDPDTNEPFNKLKDLAITCCSCGRGMMVFGDGAGYLHIMTSTSDILSYQGYVLRVQHLYQLKTRNIILSVGDDEDFSPLIRVWNMDKRDKQGNPTCARAIKAAIYRNGVEQRQSNVMAIAAHENMNIIAVGFKDGSVIVLKGNITRDRASRQSIVHTEPASSGVYVSGLAFRQVGNTPVLMIATSEAVFSFFIMENKKAQVGDVGCDLNCCTLTDYTQDFKFVIGRQEAIHFFTTEGPAQCKGFEGEKFLVRWYRGYLITASEGGRGGASRAISGGKGNVLESKTITIYDIQNQFIAYQTTFQTRIVDILSEWGSLYVLLKDGKLIKLDELDTKTKLETLFKKNLYHTAISLAKSQSYSDGLVEIFTQYGDHLYSKGDYDGAISQYKLTIGTLEPSYVIRKFLDAQRIHNLTEYLKELHEQGHANADHTTLLLNCYTKLKNVDQLDKFVMEEKASFDVEAAIRVCRQATYYDNAVALAKRFSEHNWYILITIEDLHRHGDALKYIKSLPFEAAECSMLKYGRSLVQKMPQETTQLLVKLCTNWETTPTDTLTSNVTIGAPPGKIWRSHPSKFIPAFVDKKDHLMIFLEEMTTQRECWQSVICNTLLELYLTGVRGHSDEERKRRETKALKLLHNPDAEYDTDHALMLTQTCDFREGVLYLYERTGLYQQILSYHMEHNDIEMVMDTCKRFSQREPGLWVEVLSYLASRDDCKVKIPEVLQYIEEHHLMQPLMVVQLLAQNRCATLSDIKPYIVKHLQEQNEAIAKDERQINEYRDSTSKMRDQIQDLQHKAKIFQVMKCSSCKRTLQLPAVHFLCEHSYHQNCIEDEYENECPICARDNRKVLDIIQRQEQSNDLHEQFHSQLTRSTDGFSVVAEYFGRGVFSKINTKQVGHK